MRFALLLLLASTSVPAADEASPLGEWTALSVAPLGKDAHRDSGSMTLDPGFMRITITGDHLIRAVALPGGNPDVLDERYAVAERAADRLVIVVHDPQPAKDGKPASEERVTLSRDGDRLVMVDADSRTVLLRWTVGMQKHADDVAADAKIPAPPLADGPVKGTFDGKPWQMTHVIQSQTQFDRKRLGFEILAGDPSDGDGQPQQAILVSLPQKVGHFPFGPSQGAIYLHPVTFFSPPSKNRMAVSGELVVELVDEQHLVFAFTARADKDHVVSGHAAAVRHPVADDDYMDAPPGK